jgi:glycosyltransferase involved in cell wall biosynthesis
MASGVVVIGRNEGERLARCLASVPSGVLVYVDSGSTDGSVALARARRAEVVELDAATPFTAARARNAGFKRLLELEPRLRYVQFLDGDCELDAAWLETAARFLAENPRVAAVCGRLREKHPERTVYNLLCDIEWDAAPGEARTCGGIAMMRVAAFAAAQGYRADLVAGEEPELCARLRTAGWRIWRLDQEMAAHDAAISRFGQWWRRTLRAGYAFAQGAALHGAPPERLGVRESRSAWLWGCAIPLVTLAAAPWWGAWSAIVLLAYPLQVTRLALRGARSPSENWWHALFLVLGKFPEVLGQLKFRLQRYAGAAPDRIQMNRIAYLVNEYPKVSHSFIRREILALESRGFAVQRIALRGWAGELADAADRQERARTRYVLQGGLAPLAFSLVRTFLVRPRQFIRALGLALRMAWHAERPLPYHLAYLAEACRVLPWLREFGATHVHAHFGTNSAEVVMLARALGGPAYSFTVHGPEEFDAPRCLGIAEKVRRSAFVVAVSAYGRSQLYRWVEHSYWPKIRIVHCGLENAFHDVAPAPAPGAPRVVCVGRLCEQKGQRLLLEAAARLAAQGIRLELVLAGDGELRAELEAAARRLNPGLGPGATVRITGWLSSAQVRDEILASRALVLPSLAEGLPVVLMEAMALRRPVLTTYVAGIPELVRPGENGWLVPSGDVEALAAALKDLLSQPPDALRAMGEAARRRVLERHSIDTEAGKLAALFSGAAQ